MYLETIIVPNKTGLHARPASDLAKECKQYESEIELINGDKVINAKSIIGLLSGGIKQYTEIQIRTEGADEEIAGPAIAEFIRRLKD